MAFKEKGELQDRVMALEKETTALREQLADLEKQVNTLVAAEERREKAAKTDLARLVRGEVVYKLIDFSVDFVYSDVHFRARTQMEITSWAKLRNEVKTAAQAERWNEIEERLANFNRNFPEVDAERLFKEWRDTRVCDAYPWSISPEAFEKLATPSELCKFIDELVHNAPSQKGAKEVLEFAVDSLEWLSRETGTPVICAFAGDSQ